MVWTTLGQKVVQTRFLTIDLMLIIVVILFLWSKTGQLWSKLDNFGQLLFKVVQ